MAEVNVSRDTAGSITVSFPYNPSRVTKIKTVEGRKWDPEKKYWCFPLDRKYPNAASKWRVEWRNSPRRLNGRRLFPSVRAIKI